MVAQGLEILVFCFLPAGLKKCFWILLPDLKQNQETEERKKKQTMVVGGREWVKEHKEQEREASWMYLGKCLDITLNLGGRGWAMTNTCWRDAQGEHLISPGVLVLVS